LTFDGVRLSHNHFFKLITTASNTSNNHNKLFIFLCYVKYDAAVEGWGMGLGWGIGLFQMRTHIWRHFVNGLEPRSEWSVLPPLGQQSPRRCLLLMLLKTVFKCKLM